MKDESYTFTSKSIGQDDYIIVGREPIKIARYSERRIKIERAILGFVFKILIKLGMMKMDI